MEINVLGSSGAEFPGFNPPAYLIDKKILLDAGTIGASLREKDQWNISHVILSHAHLDHVRGIPFLADNIVMKNKGHTVTVMSISPVLRTLKNNLLNNKLWPDFTKIPRKKNPVLKLVEIQTGRPVKINNYTVTAYRVNHSVPAIGYVIEDKRKKRLLYTGDTGPTNVIWRETTGKMKIHCAIIEVSLPDNMKAMALKTGHLTPGLLKGEIKKMKIVPDEILITHPKPQHIKAISSELNKLKMSNIRILKDGEVIKI